MARIDDGFSTTVAFAIDPTVLFWEKTVKPPGMDSGGPNDTTTMRNTEFRTFAPKKLKTLTPMTMTVAYDPKVYDASGELMDMIGINGLVTITFPDGSDVAFWGYIDKFEPGDNRDGEQPTATVTIQPTNQNNSGTEVAPVYTP